MPKESYEERLARILNELNNMPQMDMVYWRMRATLDAHGFDCSKRDERHRHIVTKVEE